MTDAFMALISGAAFVNTGLVYGIFYRMGQMVAIVNDHEKRLTKLEGVRV